jgi:hypothetical protein
LSKRGKGRAKQGGVGEYTLCKRCNSETGSWYGSEYVNWAHIGQPILQEWTASGVLESSFSILNVYPLRFLKQIVTMFFSLIASPVFSANHPPLMEFVLDKESQSLPSGFRFWMNFYPLNQQGSTALRRTPLAAKIPVNYTADGRILGVQSADIFDEIAHPPFALYMTMDNKVLSDAQEISGFKDYAYSDQANVTLRLKVLDSASPYPGA